MRSLPGSNRGARGAVSPTAAARGSRRAGASFLRHSGYRLPPPISHAETQRRGAEKPLMEADTKPSRLEP